jgi:uncharacterized protein HemY
VALERTSSDHSDNSSLFLKTTLDPRKNVLSLFLAISLATLMINWCALYTGYFISISSHWLDASSSLYLLLLGFMTALLVTYCITKPVSEFTHLNPEAGGSMFL